MVTPDVFGNGNQIGNRREAAEANRQAKGSYRDCLIHWKYGRASRGSHSKPFVLGTAAFLASWLTACRSAFAVALKMASAMW